MGKDQFFKVKSEIVPSWYCTIVEHQEIYINIRAELIKHFHEIYNSHNYFCSKESAIKEATREYLTEKENKTFLITLDELILYSVDECLRIIQNRRKEFITSKINIITKH